MIPDAKLDEWQRLAEAASPGPWHYQEGADAYTHIVRAPKLVFITQLPQGRYGPCQANARLIAASRDAVPMLIADLRSARAENERLRAALNQLLMNSALSEHQRLIVTEALGNQHD